MQLDADNRGTSVLRRIRLGTTITSNRPPKTNEDRERPRLHPRASKGVALGRVEGRWCGEAGIDLIAEDRNSPMRAIQAEAYDPKYGRARRLGRHDSSEFTDRLTVAPDPAPSRTPCHG